MQQSQVSVLMPVYNGAKYLRESVGSVMQQTFGQWELIVLDGHLGLLHFLRFYGCAVRRFCFCPLRYGNLHITAQPHN